MLTKAGTKTYEGLPYVSVRPRLTAMERSLLKWAVIDKNDRVLDMGLGDGLMVDYLKRNMECEVCGVSDNMELVRRTRSLVRSADLVYAAGDDIPWRNQAFDTVFLRPDASGQEAFQRQLAEVKRVLKDGGQLVLGVECCPLAVKAILRLVLADGAEMGVSRREAQEALTELGFEHITWQRASLRNGAMICWKRNPKLEELEGN